MEFYLLDTNTFFKVFSNGRKFNISKIDKPEKLYKYCSRKGKIILKDFLLVEKSVEKLISFYCSLMAKERDLHNLYGEINFDKNCEHLWVGFFEHYKQCLQKHEETISNALKELQGKITNLSKAEKFEKLAVFQKNVHDACRCSLNKIKKLAVEKFHRDSFKDVSYLVDIANLYRHAKEYVRQKNFFKYEDKANGISSNKENILTLLNEIRNLKETDNKHLLEVKKILEFYENNTTSFVNKNKKSKEKTISLYKLIEDKNTEYLYKLNMFSYIASFYFSQVQEVYPYEVKHFEGNKRVLFLREKFVELTKTYPQINSKYNEFFNLTDRYYNFIKIKNNNFVEIDRTTNTEVCEDLNHLCRDFVEAKSLSGAPLDLMTYETIPFDPYIDELQYTNEDYYKNSPAIVEKKITVKESLEEENDLSDIIIIEEDEDGSEIAPIKNVNKNLTLNQQIDEYFNGLIGLNDVKETLLEVISKKVLQGKNYQQGQMHMAFLGNPGTGKTTVARIVGDILYQNGLINSNKVVEVKFSDLYQNYVGFSAKATADKIKEAEGGVLFIDEAHQLCTQSSAKDFRKEIINTLLPELENNKNLLVIFAGYSNEMQEMLKGSDKGLFSRVNHRIDFRDFTKQEIFDLFKLEFSKRKNRNDESFVLTEASYKMVEDYFELLLEVRKNNFANGREVRITVEKILNKFGVIALNKKDIKTIDEDCMKQILTSSTFKNEILLNDENNIELENKWNNFVLKINPFFTEEENACLINCIH